MEQSRQKGCKEPLPRSKDTIVGASATARLAALDHDLARTSAGWAAALSPTGMGNPSHAIDLARRARAKVCRCTNFLRAAGARWMRWSQAYGRDSCRSLGAQSLLASGVAALATMHDHSFYPVPYPPFAHDQADIVLDGRHAQAEVRCNFAVVEAL